MPARKSPKKQNAGGELFPAELLGTAFAALSRAQQDAQSGSGGPPLAAEKKRRDAASTPVTSHRHTTASRKNLPAAGDALGAVEEAQKIAFAYDPHRSPALRFFESVHALRWLLDESKRRPLTSDEAARLAALLEHPQPWLEWAGKREQPAFEVEPVALHIHERVSAQAILRAIRREDIQRDLFADTAQSPREARAYYQHDIDWANRLITGDSLQVMTSLARRENLAGQVQMIYMDPPYGIKFSSNWQNEVGKRDVKDKDEDLCREPEMIRAYRDTWTLGVHSYLAYLKQRLIVARELLKDSGSIFVQIGEENVHRVRAVMDEVFGAENQIACIAYRTSVGLGSELLDPVCNYVVWAAKNKEQIHAQKLYTILTLGEDGATRYSKAESKIDGSIKTLSKEEEDNPSLIDKDFRPFTDQGLTSRSGSATTGFPVSFQGQEYTPTVGGWRTGQEGMQRVLGSERILKAGETIRFKKCFDDFGALALTNFWDDVGGGVSSRNDPKVYVVQTSTKGHPALYVNDNLARRPRFGPDVRQWHHRLRRGAMGAAVDND
jgi:adenine-specific DNA-methyltransferase